MDPNALREHLEALHEELSAAHSVEPRSQPALGELMQDIQRLLEHAAPAATSPTLTNRLERVAVQFEANHPSLAASSRRLIDLLGKAGL